MDRENDEDKQEIDREDPEVYGIIGDPRCHDLLCTELHRLSV
jgi:hypothetical protein